MIPAVTVPSPICKAAHFCQRAANRVVEVALKVLKTLGDIFLFPFRFLGSKSWAGYQFNERKDISPEELLQKMDLICSCAYVHTSKPSWIEPFGYKSVSPKTFSGIDPSIQARENCFFDPKTGFKATVVNKGDTYLVSFGAKGSSKSELPDTPKEVKKLNDQVVNSSTVNVLGFAPPIYDQADRFAKCLLSDPRLQNKRVIFTGQCYGGSLAAYVALRNQQKAFCVNTFPLGAGLQWQIGRKNLLQARENITQLNVKGDWISDDPKLCFLDRCLSTVGFRTPGNFGTRITIPSAFEKSADRHDRAVGSAMKHLGFETHTRPDEMLKIKMLTA